MSPRTLSSLALCCLALSAAAAPPPQPPQRYRDYYHSYSMRQQLESEESFSGNRGQQRGLPSAPSGPASGDVVAVATAAATAPVADALGAASAPAVAVVAAPGSADTAVSGADSPPPPPQQPPPPPQPTLQLGEAQQRAAAPGYYYYGPYPPHAYAVSGWPAYNAPGYVQPSWGRNAGPEPRFVVHPGFLGIHHGGALLGIHGLAEHHGGLIKGRHGLAEHHGGLIKGHHGLAEHHGGLIKGHHGLAEHHGGLIKGHHGLAEHHGGLIKGHHGLAAHHGGMIKTPIGLATHHGGIIVKKPLYLFHARDADGDQEPTGVPLSYEETVATPGETRSAAPQYPYLQPVYQHPAAAEYGPVLAVYPYQPAARSHHWHPVGQAALAPPAVPLMPGLIKGGADVALFNVHGHGSHKGLQGQTEHKYKHYNLDLGYGGRGCRPLHLLHTDAGFDVNHYTVGGASSAAADVSHGLGGGFGIL